jgi:TPR repeat protein
MNTIDIAGIRNARPLARTLSRWHRRSLACALAATVGAGFAVAWSSLTLASSQPGAAIALALKTDVPRLDRGCQDGDAVMCNDLGVSYLHGLAAPADLSLALQAFERSCRHGSPDGCGNLGALYESGAGVTASFARASRLYERACTMGCALGCSNLGALYARGLGVPRDRDEAQHLFALACDAGSAAGCNNLLQLATPER